MNFCDFLEVFFFAAQPDRPHHFVLHVRAEGRALRRVPLQKQVSVLLFNAKSVLAEVLLLLLPLRPLNASQLLVKLAVCDC